MTRSFVTLDGLRGVAALSIVVLHCSRYFGSLGWSSAFLAVDLFFCLSGFVLAFAYEGRLGNSLSPGAFLKLRWIRLYPLYLVGILLGVVEAIVTIHYGRSSIDWTWAKFWTALPFNLLMLPAPAKTLFPLNGVMWSIFFELLINAVWAIFCRPLRNNRTLLIVIGFSAVGLALSAIYFNTVNGLGASWPRFLGGFFRVGYSFFLGILLFRIHKQVTVPAIHPLILLVALPCILFLRLSVMAELAVALLVLPWFILLGAQVEPRALLERTCRALGEASYAIYTVHKRLYLLTYAAVLQILNLDLQIFAPWTGVLYAGALIAGTLLLSRLYDEPVRRWLTSRFGPKRRLDAAPQSDPSPAS